MTTIRHFKDLIVWQKSHGLFLDLVSDVKEFPRNQASRIVIDQILRSCASISANISEGFGRHSGKEFAHYLIISRGSCTETLNWYMKCRGLKWMSQEIMERREYTITEIMKMLNSRRLRGRWLRGRP